MLLAGSKWYALFTKPYLEERVREKLEYSFSDGFRAFVPKRRLRERRNGKWILVMKKLFPGYVLLNGDISDNDYHYIRSTPGLLAILQNGGLPLEIDQSEIYMIASLTGSGEIIGLSQVHMEGGIVTIVSGPLKNCEGIIQKLDLRKGRAKVRLGFLGEERTVDLGLDVIQPGIA